MTRHFPLMLIFLLLSVTISQTQGKPWIVTIATGDTLSGCSLTSLDGDSLRIEWSGFPVSLPVESVQKLQYHRTSEFWRGAFYGSSAGAVVMTLIAASGTGSKISVTAESALGIVGGFVVGGFAADYFSRDDRYDLQKCDVPEKKSIIRTLLTRSEVQAGEDVRK